MPGVPARLANGAFIGPYEIVGWLGAGGMGVVYRARDGRLGREVAIKLIPDTWATDASRVQRFAEEARAAGRVNHPNILSVYDVGTHAGAPFIVSELLEGESLRSLLQGGALPPRKAVDYARQTAEALASAHDRGIVHRDVKPDNLFITRDGRVKVLDFGIAKLTQPGTGPGRAADTPTETGTGTVIGTAGYMSPEQVRGEEVDARSDLFSVGAVLYEMLTGRPAFTCSTAAETVAAILKGEPPETMPPSVSPALERIVSRCLEKPREARFQSARDLAFGLDCLAGPTDSAPFPATLRLPWALPRSFPWIVAAGLALGLAAAVTLWAPWRTIRPDASLRLSVELGADASLATLNLQFGNAVSLSPDGAVIAFVAQQGEGGTPQLYLRRLDQLRAVPLPATDNALCPFFSPDGRWIGFFADRTLKKIAVTGGAAVALADAPSTRGGAWSEDGTIVFSPHQIAGTRLLRVSAAGGRAEPLGSLADGEVVQMWPQVLPGGKVVLYTGVSVPGALNDANLVVQDIVGGARRVVQRGGYHGRYVPSGTSSPVGADRTRGHLLYIHDGRLLAAPFDADRLEVTGEAVPALEGVTSNSITGGAQFAVSANGTFLYLPGPSTGAGTPLHWMDRDGHTAPLGLPPTNWINLRFAPDGRRLALEIREGSSDIWVYELSRETLTRLTLDPADDRKPVWAPDGRSIVFASARADGSTLNLHWQRADGTGNAERLTDSRNEQRPASWHPSGRFLAFEETVSQTNVDLMILPMEGDDTAGWRAGTPVAFLNSDSFEVAPMFSPDGRWLAYASDESGRFEVYVRPFPGPGGKWLISTATGTNPIWSPTTSALFYGANGQIMVAAFSVRGDSFRPEKPRLWSEGRYQTRGESRTFDLHPDGRRVALAPALRTPGGAPQDKVVFIFNFFDELRRLAPMTGQSLRGHVGSTAVTSAARGATVRSHGPW